ncbi:MAG: type ISP restriction/modification enzyme, partial [Pyrinomonadaceae bacterium]
HKGVVGFISNYSWLDGLAFPGMRERYLEGFDKISIDSLNGDKYKTGKLTPEGKPDPSIFSTEWNREGIQVGTAIALMVRKEKHQAANGVQFRNLWGKEKRNELLANADGQRETAYTNSQPILELGLPFTLGLANAGYTKWPLLPDLFPVSFPGVQSSRDDLVVDIDRERLVHRMEQYFDPEVSNEDIRLLAPTALRNTARFEAIKVRNYLANRGFLKQNILQHMYRPFDLRWLYWEPETKLLDEKRAEYFAHVFDGNVWLAAVQQNRKSFDPPFVTARLGSRHLVERGANLFPLWLLPKGEAHLFQKDHVAEVGHRQLNLSEAAIVYLKTVGQVEAAGELFYHLIAVLHAPQYATENAGALRQNWPRIPLPSSKEPLLHSAGLGRRVAALLDTESGIAGVTEGRIDKPLDTIGVISRFSGGQLQTEDDEGKGKLSELRINVGWGHGGKGGITMPGKGKLIERDYTTEERKAIEEGAKRHELSTEKVFGHLGEKSCDVYLN